MSQVKRAVRLSSGGPSCGAPWLVGVPARDVGQARSAIRDEYRLGAGAVPRLGRAESGGRQGWAFVRKWSSSVARPAGSCSAMW